MCKFEAKEGVTAKEIITIKKKLITLHQVNRKKYLKETQERPGSHFWGYNRVN